RKREAAVLNRFFAPAQRDRVLPQQAKHLFKLERRPVQERVHSFLSYSRLGRDRRCFLREGANRRACDHDDEESDAHVYRRAASAGCAWRMFFFQPSAALFSGSAARIASTRVRAWA